MAPWDAGASYTRGFITMTIELPAELAPFLALTGVTWPDSDEEAYRDMGDSLLAFAEGVAGDVYGVHQVVQQLLSSGDGEAYAALDRHWSRAKDGSLLELQNAAVALAGGVHGCAQLVTAMKVNVIGLTAELAQALLEAGIAGPLTMGAAAAAAPGAVAATRTALVQVIRTAVHRAHAEMRKALAAPAFDALPRIGAELAIGSGGGAVGGVAAGVGGGPAAPGTVHVDHGAHDTAVEALAPIAAAFGATTRGHLAAARGHHDRTRGRDEVAAVIAPPADQGMDALDRAAGEVQRYLAEELPAGIKAISDLHRGNDERTRKGMDAVRQHGGGEGAYDRLGGVDGARDGLGSVDPARDRLGSVDGSYDRLGGVDGPADRQHGGGGDAAAAGRQRAAD
ncbi:hypothetical protein AB0M28_37030 [Streptomyces sp. NPDC051940]|uniref:WXG100-like domain-containing protein n=1 Tax=Streptomyces sp. NPDC051940 TaxID=3155675 RepID=UPI00343B85CE